MDTVIESLKSVRRNVDAVHGQWFRDAKTIAERVSPLKLMIFYCIVESTVCIFISAQLQKEGH